MSMLAPQLNRHLKNVENPNPDHKQLKVPDSQHSEHPYLLQAIIEGFVDGVLILTQQGEWIHANLRARRICQQFSSAQLHTNSLPLPIWKICESLIDSREIFPAQKLIIDAQVETNNANLLRVRVRWLELDESDTPYLLVTIEDRNQSTHNTAIAEAKKYNLTDREAEVWSLRRANYSYKEIAAKLYITTNTVKKHLKNVYAKQQEIAWSKAEG